MNSICRSTFTDSYLCHAAEYILSNSSSAVPATDAWVDDSGCHSTSVVYGTGFEVATTDMGIYLNGSWRNCDNWKPLGVSETGRTITAGDIFYADCSLSKPLACCNSPYRESFAGFTAATRDGLAGGRAMMHLACGTEFAGSHLCHVSEYARGHPATLPPAAGAWIDSSGYQYHSTLYRNYDSARSDDGRYADPSWSNCENWTDNAASSSGSIAIPGDFVTTSCSTALSLACCF